jgi:hypothetical protein
MAVVVAPYSQNHFQSLPSLNGARDRFLKLNGDRLVEDLFTKFFVDNGMDRTFGLAMPHRHFDILPGQMMVSYNGTSTPWNASLGPGMHEPQPAVWNFSAFGDLVPIEFDYSKGRKVEMGEKERASVANFKILLEEQNLRDVFGLCAYPGDDFEGTCEITIGSANINLKPKDVSHTFMELNQATKFL